MPKPKGPRASKGLEAIRNRSNSDSCKRLDLARRFWNQILTWVSVNFKEAENSARSAIDKYCFWRNFFSKADNCWVVNGVRGLRLGLCFLNWHFKGPKGAGGFKVPFSETWFWRIFNHLFSPNFSSVLLFLWEFLANLSLSNNYTLIHLKMRHIFYITAAADWPVFNETYDSLKWGGVTKPEKPIYQKSRPNP